MQSKYMEMAIEQAKQAFAAEEVPVGAVLVHHETGEILTSTYNLVETLPDPTAHAEILAIREGAKKVGAPRLPEYDLYVTLEPCAQCAAAISFARIKNVYFAALDEKGGAIIHGPQFFQQPTCHWRPNAVHMGQPYQDESSQLLKDFFKARRA